MGLKTIIINARTAKGLDVSIRKWERVVKTGCSGLGKEGCGLCTLFNTYWGEYCTGCPIALDTGDAGCGGTPYNLYLEAYGDEGHEQDAAKKELAYLNDLKSRCEVVRGATNHVKEV